MSQIFGNGFIPNDGPSGAPTPWFASSSPSGSFPPGSPGNIGYGPANADGVRPAWFGAASDPYAAFGSTAAGGAENPYAGGGPGGLFAQFAGALQALLGRFGNAFAGTPAPAAAGPVASFRNVSLGSTGDPHLSVTGTEWNGGSTPASVNAHFDSMTSHADLFSTNDFGDGFDVATTVTQPTANGVTQNASATASMNGGLDSVTMTNAGAVSVTSGGNAVALAPGQSVTLSGGEQVSEAANGSVSIAEHAFGASLTTTFASNGGGGVDVTAQGHDVSLGGDLIAGGANPVAQPSRFPRRTVDYV
jgi:hypothetical protein